MAAIEGLAHNCASNRGSSLDKDTWRASDGEGGCALNICRWELQAKSRAAT